MQVRIMPTQLFDSVARVAGFSAAAAIPALFLAAVALALFFGGAGERWGPVNDVLVALTLLLLILPVVALPVVLDNPEGWFVALSYVAVAGLVVAAIGQLLLVAGVIGLNTSFVTGGVGILPLLAWWAGVAYLALGAGMLPSHIGWWLVGTLGLGLLTFLATFGARRPVTWAFGAGLVTALIGWLVSISAFLLAG
jgi:hypothetical protein